jgi:ABC-2 type transport system ATP-binding protein
MFALLGPNGAGKSTTIKMLTTLLPPSAGSASVDGFDIVRHAGAVRRIIGYVPQMLSADGTLTGRENLLVFARLYDVPRRERRQRVEDALDFMGLADFADKLVRQYSGGMIRRLEIAQSMIHNPRVLFLDEPTVGLDPSARRAMWEYIGELRERTGATIVLTTHQMEEADTLCDRVAIMHQGNLVALGTPGELKASIGTQPSATLDDVFIHYTGSNLESGGTYRETRRTRRSARRLG